MEIASDDFIESDTLGDVRKASDMVFVGMAHDEIVDVRDAELFQEGEEPVLRQWMPSVDHHGLPVRGDKYGAVPMERVIRLIRIQIGEVDGEFPFFPLPAGDGVVPFPEGKEHECGKKDERDRDECFLETWNNAHGKSPSFAFPW
jgi:hypothetical protein